MIDPIKAVDPAEVPEDRRNQMDLTPRSTVVGCGSIQAVIRQTVEVDPVFYGDASMNKKLMFIWGLENMLRAMGYTEYYFNVPANDEFTEYRDIVQKFGAQPTSREPEIRFKKTL